MKSNQTFGLLAASAILVSTSAFAGELVGQAQVRPSGVVSEEQFAAMPETKVTRDFRQLALGLYDQTIRLSKLDLAKSPGLIMDFKVEPAVLGQLRGYEPGVVFDALHGGKAAGGIVSFSYVDGRNNSYHACLGRELPNSAKSAGSSEKNTFRGYHSLGGCTPDQNGFFQRLSENTPPEKRTALMKRISNAVTFNAIEDLGVALEQRQFRKTEIKSLQTEVMAADEKNLTLVVTLRANTSPGWGMTEKVVCKKIITVETQADGIEYESGGSPICVKTWR